MDFRIKEPDPDYRCDQLITLYELKEAKALEAIDNLYSGTTSPTKRVELIHRITDFIRWQPKEAGQDALIDWLWKVAGTDTSPYCRQECLSVLYTNLGQEKALEQYIQDTDQNGVMGLTQENQVFMVGGLNWQFLKAASQKYPQSYLARGIKAYEAVRGIPYFEIDRINEKQSPAAGEPPYWDGQYPPYGDEQYQPDREIPGWEKFLAEFPRHPASDDAAYRLARCYEIKGRFADAVKTIQKARFSTDGDIRYAAAGRMVYILDVRMTYEQLKELSLEKLDPALQAFINYSLAVREIRREDYPRAASQLEEFLKQEENLATDKHILPFDNFLGNEQYDFHGAVKKQLDEVNKLDNLKSQWEKSKTTIDLYNLAAAIFHNQMLYYNHLWAGQRQYYNWLEYITYQMGRGHAPVEMAAFIREMINYNHSLPYFQQVYLDPSSSPELKAKALYSTGLCYTGLHDWGEDAAFAFNSLDTRKKIISTYQQFVEEYPDSSMADDALLALGSYTGNTGYLQKIIKEYPDGDMLEKAKKLMPDLESPYYSSSHLFGSSVPFKILSLNDESIPPKVKEWAAANSLRSFSGTKISGEWSYMFISAGEKPTAGYSVGIIGIYSDNSSKLKVRYKINNPAFGEIVAQVISYPSILLRIPASAAPVEFVEESPQ
jgi:tetratricopeptide (TPR) repeat protein